MVFVAFRWFFYFDGNEGEIYQIVFCASKARLNPGLFQREVICRISVFH